MMLSLAQALRVDRSPCIAFIGAGGKTTAMFLLARQFATPVIVTATTHLGTWQTNLADRHIITDSPTSIEELEDGLSGVILITGRIDGDRTTPVNDVLLEWLHQFCGYHAIPLLIEADGSRQKSIKAWADHEPVIPPFVNQVVNVTGLSGLGKPLTDEYIHRPELFSKSTGLGLGETVTTSRLTNLLLHDKSILNKIPQNAIRTIILNQADTPDMQSMAHSMVGPLLSLYHSVIISSLIEQKVYAVHEKIAGIILAAGASSRFGESKQLLNWHGQPFIHAVAKTALEAGLSPVLIITGADGEKVKAAVQDLDVTTVDNPEWKNGQGSSIKTGISSLHTVTVGGAIFLLSDQPQVTTSVLRALKEKHAEGLYPIVAPMVIDQRANPVLFDRSTFKDLQQIEGDVGGRAIFHKHRIEYLPWHDDRLLLDVDTPEMYQRLISDDTL
jgi:molybdenum cofactor cytidylyltransferase